MYMAIEDVTRPEAGAGRSLKSEFAESLVDKWYAPDRYPNTSAVALLDAELSEVRDVLERLIEFSDQVIEAFGITPMPAHRVCFQRARALYEKLTPKE